MKNIAYAIVAAAIAVLCSGCAVFNRENTPTTHFVEHKLMPKKQPYRTLSFSYMVPVGLVALTTDALIVRPVSVSGNAWQDTKEALWEDFEWDDEYVSSCGSVVLRSVATPIVLPCDFLARAAFDIPNRGHVREEDDHRNEPPPVEQPEVQKVDYLALARECLARNQTDCATENLTLAIAQDTPFLTSYGVWTTKLQTEADMRDLAVLLKPALTEKAHSLTGDTLTEVLSLLKDGSPAVKFFILQQLDTVYSKSQVEHPAVLSALANLTSDDNKALALQALRVIGGCDRARTSELLKRIAAGNDPVLSLAASAILQR